MRFDKYTATVTASPRTAASDNRFRILFDTSFDPIVIVNQARRFVDANAAACALLGYSRTELMRTTVDQVTPAATRERLHELWTEFMRAGQLTGEYLLRRKDGSTALVEFRSVANFVPGLHLTSFRDVTERKHTEPELRRQKELLELIVDNIPIMLNFVDTNGRMGWTNREWERVLGWTLEEARRIDVLAHEYPDPDDYADVIRSIRDAPQDWRDFRTRRKDGTVIDTAWAHVLLSDGTTIGIGQDISDRKRAEEALRGSHEQLRQLSARLGRVSEHERAELARELHDQFGQVLTALKMDVRWIDQQFPADLPGSTAVREKMLAIGAMLDSLIHQVRRISAGLRPIALDKLGLLDAIEGLCEDFERRSGIRCRLKRSGGEVRLDSNQGTQLFRIVQEAFTNIMRHAGASRVIVSATRRRNAVILAIRDNGRGITDDQIKNPQSLGLLGMQERAIRAGAALAVGRAGKKGTIVRIVVPPK